jgi:Uncharacterized protein conserved in bacteria
MNNKKTKIHTFHAVLEKQNDGMDTAFVSIPFNVEKEYGTKGQVKVKATFDGHPYRGVIANMGTGCHIIGVRKDVRAAIGKKVGESILITIEEDKDERIVDIPVELKKLLSGNKSASEFFDSLSYTNKKEYALWISSAKKEETKLQRLALTREKLLSGKKNPAAK